MRCLVVCHTHWDREWYRTFEEFRARLVDVVDALLEALAAEAGFRFVLDGQSVVLEDYLEVRPDRRDALAVAIRAGRLSVGPWWVQPDSLLPAGETHVRNLLEGRRVAAALGPASRVAYVPDAFGHPAQLPQLFAGFGLEPFVYWRGDGDETHALGGPWCWEAPDGSAVSAIPLPEGYFAASGLPRDAAAAAAVLQEAAGRIGARDAATVAVLPVGFDHAAAEPHAVAAATALAAATGWDVRVGVLDDLRGVAHAGLPRWRGPLVGARVANLLPGVWSARMPLKLASRRAEAELTGWAEPWAALAAALGLADERPALRVAWRALLTNQAHDSIGGCSLDRVHEQMPARFARAQQLGAETTARALGRIAGQPIVRESPWTTTFEIAVFNPSAHARTDVVRVPLVPERWVAFRAESGERSFAVHPWITAGLGVEGYTADGDPARLVRDEASDAVRVLPECAPLAVELVVRDVPAFGWRRVRLAPSGPHPDAVDEGRDIVCEDRAVAVARDGTLEVAMGGRRWAGLAALEDVGDRGDTYDHDPVPGPDLSLREVAVRRGRHPAGTTWLAVRRTFDVPVGLDADRARRATASVALTLDTEVRLAPGVPRVDLAVRVANTARDHRLRLRFPTGARADVAHAATTFDVAAWPTRPADARAWVHPATAAFPQHGFVHAGGLTVVAPGLPEAEVTPDGAIAITLLRSVGWLARMDLRSRPQPAGPAVPTPGAQCAGTLEARLALLAGLDVRGAQDAELGLRAVVAGATPRWPAGKPLLAVEPADVVVSACKPAEVGPGLVLRLLNPGDAHCEAHVRYGVPFASAVPVRLDETPCGPPLAVEGGVLRLPVPPHALRSVLLVP